MNVSAVATCRRGRRRFRSSQQSGFTYISKGTGSQSSGIFLWSKQKAATRL